MTGIDLSPQHARRMLAAFGATEESETAIQERFARTVWSILVEPGDGIAGGAIAEAGPLEALRRVLAESGSSARNDPFGAGVRRWSPRLQPRLVDEAVRLAVHSGTRLLTPADPEWPSQVDGLGVHAPIALWVRGNIDTLARLRPSVAIVGARAATSYGDHVAGELAADLAGSGIPIVSGAAYGIDGSAHRAAIAVGGTTVALLAGGADRAYPAGHTDLLARIVAVGAVVSEVPCGSAPTRWRFLQRNRLIAALADATIVVEAGWRSGSLNTAGHAAALGRALGAVPGPITSAASAGSHRLLREFGAECITSGDDVRELIGMGTSPTLDRPADDRPPTDDATRVRDALSQRSWRDAQDIARRSGLSRDEVEGRLGFLLLEDRVERSAAGWRLRPTR